MTADSSTEGMTGAEVDGDEVDGDEALGVCAAKPSPHTWDAHVDEDHGGVLEYPGDETVDSLAARVSELEDLLRVNQDAHKRCDGLLATLNGKLKTAETDLKAAQKAMTASAAGEYRAQRDVAIEFLVAYRGQGSPGRVGRAMLDEFLAGVAESDGAGTT